MKAKYKELTGTDFPVAGRGQPKKEKELKPVAQKKEKPAKEKIIDVRLMFKSFGND